MSGLTAIVCDDDAETRKSVCTLVTACGFEVVAELDLAVSAVPAAELVGPTLVLLNLSSPGVASLRAIPLLREAAPGCEVVVCSSSDAVRPAALGAGASDVVDKGDDYGLEQVLRNIADRRTAASKAATP